MAIENLITDHLDLWTAAVRPKSSVGRGSNSKLELTGIKKLRELILELAVRGKLTDQQVKTESAADVINDAVAAKDILSNEMNVRTDKDAYSPVELLELPTNWTTVCIGQIAYVLGGKRIPKGHVLSDEKTKFVYLRVTDMKKQSIDDADLKYISEEVFREISKYTISKNDIYVTIAGTIGAVGCVPEYLDGANLTENAAKLVFRCLSIDYLTLVLQSSFVQRQFAEAVNKMAQPKLSLASIKHTTVIVPPIQEQHRIVAKVDELMAICDQLEQQSEAQLAAHQTLVETLLATLTDSCDAEELAQNWARLSSHFDILFTTEASIDALKQTILQLAVMGKLVPQDPSDEPASALLERIAAKKAQLVKEKKIKKEKPLPAISEDEKPFELPQGWEWARLGNIGICSTGKTPSTGNSAFYDGEIPFIGPGQITPSGKLLAAEKYLSDVGLELSSEANAGDILMVCIGGSIGKATICDRQIGFNQQINSIRPILCDSYFLLAAMTTKAFTNLLLERATGSATPIINRSKWEEIPIPISPYQEQLRIISRVHELMTLCDQLKSRLQTSLQTQLALAESLVEGALA
ncbi:restriction endonuclease subunit S [Aeromonas hydrophila]|uniref:restriction endonuclease subunit S n=1 Tax=Aeromonas hydrophila TaxID=644 RepID=UPI000E56F248|nr:restriction endonuclease subunit S [Aeromonas hydrophila]AXV36527.1 restriction endonuclease subunit S [Aeromonas hydrophila]